MSRLISVAARQKGGDLDTNPQLRMIVDKARSFNMPAEGIEPAIKKATGELEGVKMEEFMMEAYGPGGIAILTEGITDNKNRTISELKYLIGQHNGKMAEVGSVSWMFEKKGTIIINLTANNLNKDEIELTSIDCGADDLKWQTGELLEIFTSMENLEAVKKTIEQKGIKIESSSLDWTPKTEIEVSDQKTKEQIEKLFEALEENDDVNEIYSNLSATSN